MTEPTPIEPGCPHCIDGHDDPRRKPWSAWVATHVDGDGQHTHLIVAPSAGAHVAESDARWLRKLIREYRSDSDLPGEFDQ